MSLQTFRKQVRGGDQAGISVIIPTYNERENISYMIGRTLKTCSEARLNPEILVVDDDSEDYTWLYPTRLFGVDPRVRVIRRQTDDTGLAQSVVDGFVEANHDYIAVIDADGQHPPEKLSELFLALEKGADIAVGTRHAKGGGIENWPWWRKLVSKGGKTFATIAIPEVRGISDPMSGFFAMRQEVVQEFQLNPQGYKILLEVLTKGTYGPENIAEVPYVFSERERGESKLSAAEYKNFLEHLGQLSIISRGLDDVVDPKQAVRGAEFAFVGATGTIVNMAVFALLTSSLGVHFLLAGMVAFLAAVNWNFALNYALTYDFPPGNTLQQYIGFHTYSAIGFVVYTLILTSLVIVNVPELLANLLAILAGAGVNFLGSDTRVFLPSQPGVGSTDDSRPISVAK